jgi:hypothetical protein
MHLIKLVHFNLFDFVQEINKAKIIDEIMFLIWPSFRTEIQEIIKNKIDRKVKQQNIIQRDY